MKKITIIGAATTMLLAAMAFVPASAHACFNGCGGGYYQSYTYSGGGVDYPYQSPTWYYQSYIESNGGYNYPYSYSYPTNYGNYYGNRYPGFGQGGNYGGNQYGNQGGWQQSYGGGQNGWQNPSGGNHPVGPGRGHGSYGGR